MSSATANHHGSSVTTAKGDGTGTSTAVGAAIALGFVDDSAVASTARSITADKAVSFTASADGASQAEAMASAVGADKRKKTEERKGRQDGGRPDEECDGSGHQAVGREHAEGRQECLDGRWQSAQQW